MSTISNRHQINVFIPGKSTALTNQRLAKVGWKTTKTQKAAYKNICVSIPVITDETIIPFSESLLPYVRGLLNDAQDGIIRSLYESSEGARTGVNDEEISIAACIAYLESQAAGGRLTIKSIEDWFDRCVKDGLILAFAEKLGFELSAENEKVEMEIINKHLNAYKGLFSALSGGKTVIQVSQISGLEKALSLATDDDSDIADKITARLNAMKVPKSVEELLEI